MTNHTSTYAHTTGALAGTAAERDGGHAGEPLERAELEDATAEALDSVARLLEPVSPWGVALAAALERDAARVRAAGAAEGAPF